MVMTDIHEPTPEFVARLEWQVRSTLSRRDRFARPTRRPAYQIVKMAALILVSVFCGAAGVVTADQVQEARTRTLLLQQLDMEMELAGLQLQYLRTRVAEIEDLYDTGQVDEETLTLARHELRKGELRYARLQIDREEIELTGREPQQTVSAPPVGDRDFVAERLDLELALASQAREIAQKQADDARRLFAAGMAGEEILREHEIALANATQLLYRQSEFQHLRERFLAGEISAGYAEQAAKIAEAESQLDQIGLERARQALDRIGRLYEQGVVRQSEVVEARLEVLERELRMQQLMIMIENLRSALQEEPPPR
jgi:hypothetical protein